MSQGKEPTEPNNSGSYWNWDAERTGELNAQKRSKTRAQRRWLFGGIGTLLVLVLAYIGLAFYLGERIPSNTQVSGIPVGGLTKDEAASKISEGLKSQTEQPKSLSAKNASKPVPFNPTDAALQIDPDASLNQLVGFSLNPARIFAHFGGGATTTAVAKVDEARLKAALEPKVKELSSDPVEPTISFDKAKADVVTTQAKDGVQIDLAQASSYLKENWFNGSKELTLPSKTAAPQVTNEKMAAFVKESVKPIISKPVSVMLREKVITLEPADLGTFLNFEAKDGKLSVTANQQVFKETLRGKSGGLLKDPVDARIEIVNHTTPTIIPSQPGEVVNMDKLSTDLLAIGTQSDRTLKPEVINGEPEFTTEAAQKMGIKEVVSEISTPITSDAVRTTNLKVGSGKVSNQVIKPGEEFNLEKLLSPITTENGFVSSGVLLDGFGSEAVGGGLSQLSTNTFNVGYRAGMVDVEHRPHTQYYSRYPAGMESTLWSGQVNMIWKNNTPYGAVVDSYVSGGQLVTKLWSTKHWDVQIWSGPRQNIVPAKDEINTKKDCTPYGPGNPGFTITVGRKVSLQGDVHEDSKLTWHYNPQNGSVCQ
ncbi:VanW family protein [Arcanobacterium ihumii]|uniref:VanW family protein n=1 Tax=Arcanobacterium ihumii TaxID=2138162 RepID=UPI000F52124E|nr:VanW family protein [Arcanobacterium ihumii]